MWRSVLALSIFAGTAVFSGEVTFPVSVEFGEDLLNFSEENGVLHYTVERTDKSSSRSTKPVRSSLIFESSDGTKSVPNYAIEDCATAGEACVKLIANDVNVVFRKVRDERVPGPSSWVVMNTTSDGTTIGTCQQFQDGVHWFGGPEAKYQIWPVQDAQWNFTVFHPKEDDAVAIAEPYWLSSAGTYFYVNPETALFIDQNYGTERSICMYAQNEGPYRPRGYTLLEYWLAEYSDPREAHEAAAERFFPRPTGIPDVRMISQPIWSTWARYKIYVNESIVRTYANEILVSGFNHSQLEIDDFWETCYGSLTFNTNSSKFPDIKNLTDDLHALGFRVTLWVHPFINADCTEYYEIARTNNYFARNENGSIFTTWWQGTNSSVIDFTNEAAVAWFTRRLRALKESAGIDSFKFDAGEASWVPEPAVLTASIDETPGIYTSSYVRALAEFGTGIEVRVGWQTQDLPIFVRMLDKDTSWTFDNGLPTLITTLLVMNLAGYGFVLPDMVGGNGYIDGVLVSTEYPSKELFIRWLQANTFMPAIQYSFVPWDYDSETVEICRRFTELHEEYAPTIIEAMNAAVNNGTPVNPPVWWVDPTNPEAYNISDEYLLGEVILVAPVVVEGAVTRDIFLPRGSWVDASTGSYAVYDGPVTIYNYSAPLDVLPYFVELNYWQSLDKESSGAFPQSSGLTVLFSSAILTLIAKLLN